VKSPVTPLDSRDVTVRVSGIAAIPAVLEQLGARPDDVLAAAQVDRSVFDDESNSIGFATVGHLVRECVARTGCEHFGVLVGQHGGPKSFGLIGLAMRHTANVHSALTMLATYIHLYYGGQTLTLEEHGDVAVMSYAITSPGVEAVDQIEDGALAIFFNVLRSLCGPDWLPLEVRFAHRRPKNVRPFIRAFQTTLTFDAERSALVMSSHWLRRSLTSVDAELESLLRQQIENLKQSRGKSFPDAVRDVLRTALLAGHANADYVADMFSMHRRTLNRHLSASGVTFAELVDEGRFEISRRMLEYSDLDVKQIAAALDYADASAFTRAFKRWSGTTPVAWRTTYRPTP